HDPISPRWTSRDVYAHLSRWIERSTSELEARLEGGTLQPLEGTDDEVNARWQREDSGLGLGEARERAQQAFERRLRAIEAVPADRWDEMLEAIARADGAEHYAGHRSYISVT
ncbi:MAG: maleylpyruvate isomerase N-terminal domain-containing protein, partial [Chloroflexi bacterium]|nr:maleylpyruvate isomerase N-terminal domain-containing protein [Chloroflexota bacterium]